MGEDMGIICGGKNGGGWGAIVEETEWFLGCFKNM